MTVTTSKGKTFQAQYASKLFSGNWIAGLIGTTIDEAYESFKGLEYVDVTDVLDRTDRNETALTPYMFVANDSGIVQVGLKP
jgi:hypothetical protein